jgi:hypothetical protein
MVEGGRSGVDFFFFISVVRPFCLFFLNFNAPSSNFHRHVKMGSVFCCMRKYQRFDKDDLVKMWAKARNRIAELDKKLAQGAPDEETESAWLREKAELESDVKELASEMNYVGR